MSFPKIVVDDKTFTPPAELSDYDIQMIHSGLLIPSANAIFSMARELRKWRGVKNPDSA